MLPDTAPEVIRDSYIERPSPLAGKDVNKVVLEHDPKKMDSRLRGNDILRPLVESDSGNESRATSFGGDYCRPVCISAALIVFVISIATVIGPTPPGTGVIAPATRATDSKCASPTIR